MELGGLGRLRVRVAVGKTGGFGVSVAGATKAATGVDVATGTGI
jgi:hypothetical protein